MCDATTAERLAWAERTAAHYALSTRSVLLAIGYLAMRDDLAVSQEQIAQRAGCTVRTVRRVVSRLAADGIVEVLPLPGRGRSYGYRLGYGAEPPMARPAPVEQRSLSLLASVPKQPAGGEPKAAPKQPAGGEPKAAPKPRRRSKPRLSVVPKRVDPRYVELAREMSADVRAQLGDGAAQDSTWPDVVRLLVEVDGIPLDHIRWLWKWCRNDEFWRENVQSPQKFRRKNKDGHRWWNVLKARAKTDVARRRQQRERERANDFTAKAVDDSWWA